MDLGRDTTALARPDAAAYASADAHSGPSAQAINIALVGCPFRTTYGRYITSLRAGLARATGAPVRWVATNCGCGDPVEIARDFEVRDSDYFETISTIARQNIVGYSRDPLKRALKSGIRSAGNRLRAARFAELASDADLIHMQQTLGAFGSDVAFRLLRQPIRAARVITLHELDPEQTDLPERNTTYNLADALIVHDSLMKARLVALGVEADRLHVVRCGTDLAEGEEAPREGVVFYGGHTLGKGKGLDVLFEALRRVKDRARVPAPRLRIHGHYGKAPPADALELAARAGVAGDVDWLNELSMAQTADLYRRSQVCVVPFTGSFAGLAVGVAAANRLPIISTRFAGVPDHIGDLGLWIEADDPAGLAERLEQVLGDEGLRQARGEALRAHAEQHLGWDTVARETLAVYRAARERAAARRG
jgi:glycosyltransferase involved in cell wall biosynthesis